MDSEVSRPVEPTAAEKAFAEKTMFDFTGSQTKESLFHLTGIQLLTSLSPRSVNGVASIPEKGGW